MFNFESNIEDEQLSDNEQTDQATNNNLPSAVTYARVKYPRKGTYAGYFQDKNVTAKELSLISEEIDMMVLGRTIEPMVMVKKLLRKLVMCTKVITSKDKRQGWGMYIWANGDKYGQLAPWYNAGEGTFIWARGDVYQGSWLKGK